MSKKKISTPKARQRDRIAANDVIITTKRIIDRTAYPVRDGAIGTFLITFEKDEKLVAATNEIGGNDFAHARTGNEPVIVPLAEGEWKPA